MSGIFAVEMVPRRAKRDAAPASLFDLVRGFSARVPLSRLLQVEEDVRPYLAAVVVDAVKQADDALVIPKDLNIIRMEPDQFEDHKLGLAAKQYQPYGILGKFATPKTAAEIAAEAEEAQRLREAGRDARMTEMTTALARMGESMRAMQEMWSSQAVSADSALPGGATGSWLGHSAMEAESSRPGLGYSPPGFQPGPVLDPSTVEFIGAVELKAISDVSATNSCVIVEVRRAAEPMSRCSPEDKPRNVIGGPQPSFEAIVSGGKTAKWGQFMADTGAAFSMATTQFAQHHGLKIEAGSGTFR